MPMFIVLQNCCGGLADSPALATEVIGIYLLSLPSLVGRDDDSCSPAYSGDIKGIESGLGREEAVSFHSD